MADTPADCLYVWRPSLSPSLSSLTLSHWHNLAWPHTLQVHTYIFYRLCAEHCRTFSSWERGYIDYMSGCVDLSFTTYQCVQVCVGVWRCVMPTTSRLPSSGTLGRALTPTSSSCCIQQVPMTSYSLDLHNYLSLSLSLLSFISPHSLEFLITIKYVCVYKGM